jgi:transcriptional regulator GlxA family with amidase domain
MEHPVIAILLFDNVEVLDFAAPYEVFTASRNESGQPHTTAFTLADKPQVQCYGSLRVIPDHILDKSPSFDVLIIPGGPGAREKKEPQHPLIQFIQNAHRDGKLIASICTGSFLLARAGLLDGRRATTHPSHLDQFARDFPAITAERAKLIDQTDIITAGGVTSGIDLSLYLLERWFGSDARAQTPLRGIQRLAAGLARGP